MCGVTAFCIRIAQSTDRRHRRNGKRIGSARKRESKRHATQELPTPAGLNMMAQKYFEQHGSGNKQHWDLAFEHGYEDGFNEDASVAVTLCYAPE